MKLTRSKLVETIRKLNNRKTRPFDNQKLSLIILSYTC